MVMDKHSRESLLSAEQLQSEIDRCHREIETIESLLIAGHRDVAGLCLALADWSAELNILQCIEAAPMVRPSD